MFSQQQQQEQTGVNLYLSFDDIERGMNKEFEVEHYKKCERCNGSGGEPGSKITKCPECNGSGRKHIHQNTFFGMFDMVTACNVCGGKGKTYETRCKECKGNGMVLVKERFKVNVEKSGKDKKEKPKKGFFGIF
jgi:molecular chaperone DnaJ